MNDIVNEIIVLKVQKPDNHNDHLCDLIYIK